MTRILARLTRVWKGQHDLPSGEYTIPVVSRTLSEKADYDFSQNTYVGQFSLDFLV